MIRDIVGKSLTDDEFHVIDLDGPVRIIFQKQVEDIIINCKGDLLIGWDYASPADFTSDNAMLYQAGDKMKEITKERCTHFYLMPLKEGEKLRAYLVAQK
jgi:hypothetical protein